MHDASRTLHRLGLKSARTVAGDLTRPLDSSLATQAYHRILLDAPCSGLGVLRRHPEALIRRSPDDLAALAAQQLAMLATVAPALRPGGLITYAVCTFERQECEEVVAAFLRAHPMFHVEPATAAGGRVPWAQLMDPLRRRPDLAAARRCRRLLRRPPAGPGQSVRRPVGVCHRLQAMGNIGGDGQVSRGVGAIVRPLRIAPSILSADFGRLGEEVRAVEAAGADYIHVDVMDGRFVPNITIGPMVVAAVRKATKLPLDVHLMIVEPERYVDEFAAAGADLDQRARRGGAAPAPARSSRSARSARRAAVALNPHTPLDGLDVVLPELDDGAAHDRQPRLRRPEVHPRRWSPRCARCAARSTRRGLDVDIEVDGGIDADTAPAVVAAGATVLVAGSAVFHARGGDYRGAISALRSSVGP